MSVRIAVGGERGAGGVGAARAVHAAAGMRRRRREEQAAHRGLGPTEARDRAEHRLLRERGGAAAERAAGEVGVARLERRWAQHVAPGDQRSGSRARDPRSRPRCGRRTSPTSAASHWPVRSPPASPRTLQRNVRVRPHRLGAGGRTGRVGLVHLADEHERVRRDAVLRQVGGDLGEAVHAVAEVHGPGTGRRLGPPGDRARQRPVDLERGRVVLEPLEVGDDLAPAGAPRPRGRGTAPAHRRRRAPRVARRWSRRRPARPRPRAGRARRCGRRARCSARCRRARSRRSHQRGGELAGAALGHGKAELLTRAR